MRILISSVLILTVCATAHAQRLNYGALISSAKIYLEQTPKDFDKAQLRLEEAIANFPDQPPIEAHVLLGEINAEKRNYPEMAMNFSKADSICANSTDKKIKKRCDKERIQERVRDVSQSVWINEFNEGAQNIAEGKDLLDELSEIEDEEEREEVLLDLESIFRDALDNFESSSVIAPDSAQGWINLGITYYNLSTTYGHTGEDESYLLALKDSSISAYKKALEMHPDNFDLLSNLSTLYFELEQWDDCAKIFGKMANLQPDNAIVLQNLAMLLFQIKMDDSARVITDKAIQYDPENADLRMRRAFLTIEDGRLINDTIVQLRSQEKAADLAEIDRLTEKRDAAYGLVVQDLTVVTGQDPTNYEAWYFLGACSYFLENYEAARDAWEKATEVKPDQVEVWERLAPLYLRLGQAEKSKEAEAKIKELKGN